MLNLFNNFIFLKLDSANGNSKEENIENIEKKITSLNSKLTESSVLNNNNKEKVIDFQVESLD